MKDQQLEDALNDATNPIYMDNKEQLVDYYQEKYPANWTRKIAEQIQPFTDNRAGTGPMSIANIMRNFQGDRLQKTQKSIDFGALGQQLPPIRRELKPGQNSITITVKGDMHQGPRGGTEPLTATATFYGNDATMFINNPSYEGIYEEYGMEGDLLTDGDYVNDVYSVSAA